MLHGTRDIHEVAQHIRDEFETASNFGIEVVVLLEVYKLPYHSKLAAFKGFRLLSSMHVKKYLNKIGLEKEDYLFWKKAGKALLCTYAIFGAVWIYNETSPLGWWPLKPRPTEEQELAHLYERREFPYPGNEGAMKEFIAKGGMIGTTSGSNGMIGNDKNAYSYQKELEGKKFDQEAQKVWLGMRDEVIAELKEKGFDVKSVQ